VLSWSDDEYEALRSLAASYLRRNSGALTLQATALVHEVYLKLAPTAKDYADRRHFMASAATAMRHILVDHARARQRSKRGGGQMRTTLDGVVPESPDGVDILIVNDALGRLAALDERQSSIVELRVFMGLNIEEISELLAISEKTVRREWSIARAWLQRELRNESSQ
jgi:RNA polymerase sigma factor (TIGR02999 family)